MLTEDCPVPYAIVFSLSDVNESSLSAENMEAMTFAILNARFVSTVIFHASIMQNDLRFVSYDIICLSL